MNVLDSPIAFNPFNLGPILSTAVNSFWAWISLITAAAFSICTFRRHSTVKPLLPSPEPQTTPSDPSSIGIASKTTPSRSVYITSKTTSFQEEEEGVLIWGDSFKKRFTTYYKEQTENVNEEDEVDGGDHEPVLQKRWRSTVQIMRSGSDSDLGWYGYQDRRVIDGSVVRLWEESQRCFTPRRQV